MRPTKAGRDHDKNPINAPSIVPKGVKNAAAANASAGHQSLKNLVRVSIFFLFSGSVNHLNRTLKR